MKEKYKEKIPKKRNYPPMPFKISSLNIKELFSRPLPSLCSENLNTKLELEQNEMKAAIAALPHLEQKDPGKRLLALLKQDMAAAKDVTPDVDEVNDEIDSMLLEKKLNFERHTINCINEHERFVTFRQIYPNKDIEGLWDLFVKCNGDVDWCVDILLLEAENETYMRNEPELEPTMDKYVCNCNNIPKGFNKIEQQEESVTLPPLMNKNVTKRKNRSRNSQSVNNEDLKKTVEDLFQMTENQYSMKLRLRQKDKIKQDNEEKSLKLALQLHEELKREDEEPSILEQQDDSQKEEKEEIIKLNFGHQLISQLSDLFKDELSLSDIIPKNFNRHVDVWIPREMAKELYLMWAESVYNVCEDERAQMMRDDEELALAMAQNENECSPGELGINSRVLPPMDLATQITLQKLYEDFPDIPKETLYEILTDHDRNYQVTMQILKTVTSNDETRESGSGVSAESGTEGAAGGNDENQSNTNSSDSTPRRKVNSLNEEERKRRTILEFEETRNSAAHHARLKFECYRKAKEAIQGGNHGAALYFSEVSRMHTDKIEHYNHQAANCIMNAHKLTKNTEILDLHYLHLNEAVVCLDIFLDRHIANLQALKIPYKNLFIITGRGLHSAMGVSTIKAHVKARLRTRYLRWTEVNPGLLKVKLFKSK